VVMLLHAMFRTRANTLSMHACEPLCVCSGDAAAMARAGAGHLARLCEPPWLAVSPNITFLVSPICAG
jgi:hypothetical protein